MASLGSASSVLQPGFGWGPMGPGGEVGGCEPSMRVPRETVAGGFGRDSILGPSELCAAWLSSKEARQALCSSLGLTANLVWLTGGPWSAV